MPRRFALVFLCFLALAMPSCGGQPSGPLLVGGREVKSWVNALKDPDPRKRRVAVLKLGNVGDADSSAADALGLALLDTDNLVRRDAVLAVNKLRKPSALIVDRLRIMSETDPDPRARDLARKSVARQSGGS